MTKATGSLAMLTYYVDADHARDKLACCCINVNNTPITWVFKHQKTVETSSYRSAARIAVDLHIEMRYNLRMLGIKVEESSVLIGDNMAVVINTTLLSSALKKKHQACNYHRIREAIAAQILTFSYMNTGINLANVCTKPLRATLFHSLLKPYMFHRPKFIEETKLKKEHRLEKFHIPPAVVTALCNIAI
jgi:hypothetical protein